MGPGPKLGMPPVRHRFWLGAMIGCRRKLAPMHPWAFFPTGDSSRSNVPLALRRAIQTSLVLAIHLTVPHAYVSRLVDRSPSIVDFRLLLLLLRLLLLLHLVSTFGRCDDRSTLQRSHGLIWFAQATVHRLPKGGLLDFGREKRLKNRIPRIGTNDVCYE